MGIYWNHLVPGHSYPTCSESTGKYLNDLLRCKCRCETLRDRTGWGTVWKTMLLLGETAKWSCQERNQKKKRLSAPKRVIDANLCSRFEYQAVSRRRYTVGIPEIPEVIHGEIMWNSPACVALNRPHQVFAHTHNVERWSQLSHFSGAESMYGY